MKQNILNLDGAKALNKNEQKTINGGFGGNLECKGGPCNKGKFPCPNWDFCLR